MKKNNFIFAALVFSLSTFSIATAFSADALPGSFTMARISKFSGVAANGENQLTWETITEDNVKQYDIEYSFDNRDYQRGGVLSASDKDTYTYNHIITTRPVIFYRLKIVDFNGANAYSDVIRVENSFVKTEDFIAPTVIRDNVLNITVVNNYRNLQVFNSAGVEVYREYLGGKKGTRLGFTLPTLPAGPYYAKLVGLKTSVTKKFMVSL